jgi:DNA polymerase III gamma/tau subunit
MPFADIIGHDSAKTLLRSAILQNRLAHAYLFHGDDRIGKRLLALRLAQALLCETVSTIRLRMPAAPAGPAARWTRAPIPTSW